MSDEIVTEATLAPAPLEQPALSPEPEMAEPQVVPMEPPASESITLEFSVKLNGVQCSPGVIALKQV